MSTISQTSSSTLPSSLNPNLKLTHENYTLWSTLIVPYLEGQSLFGYVTRDTPCPPQYPPPDSSTSNTESSLPVLNPAFSIWYQQDKLILSMLLSTLSESTLTHVVGLKTSHEVWKTLERMFAAQSQAREMQCRYQLATLKKELLPSPIIFKKLKLLLIPLQLFILLSENLS
jgi:hypothetical protein